MALESASAELNEVPFQATLRSPLRLRAWERALRTLPDRAFVHFLLRGIKYGFCIGVQGGARFRASNCNLKSAYKHLDVITAYLKREVQLGRLHILPLLQLSPFGVIPKKYKPNKWHLIVDLSSPAGGSVNDAISKDLCPVSYASIDNAVEFVQSLGLGCLLAKLDLKEAYRAVPVHPSDQRLLGVRREAAIYIDRALPSGLRSAPKLFSSLTDAMMWVLHERGVVAALHYLEDFLVLGPPSSPACEEALTTTLALCEELGFLCHKTGH